MNDIRRGVDHPLIRSLHNPACYRHDVASVRLIETHISWVLLTGGYAYKIKKPVKFPFVDFSSLRRRRSFCEQELRLNRRLAPELYLSVVPIGGSVQAPAMESEPAIEYAVKLREFPLGARLDEQLAQGGVPVGDVRCLAETIAAFHASLPPSDTAGSPVAITRVALDNVAQAEHALGGPGAPGALAELREWITQRCLRLKRAFAQRQRAGAIREAHGDLHLENLVYWDGRVVPFDALEFDSRLRWIDVMDEVAFLVMDLMAHGETGLAYAFLNRYLEITGDYAGLEVLRFYLVHRALIRAKVAALKASRHAPGAQRIAAGAEPDPYLRCARSLVRPAAPLLLIAHGLSGSGKTHTTDRLIERLPAVRLRSDLERKRLHGLGPLERSGSRLGAGVYAASATRATYDTLLSHADLGLRAGLNVVVDATFLRRAERAAFRRLAAEAQAGFAILSFTATQRVLRERVERRAARGGDASEATPRVLDHQLAAHQPPDAEELAFVLTVNTENEVDYAALERRIKASQPPPRGRGVRPSERPSSPSPGRDGSRRSSGSPRDPSR